MDEASLSLWSILATLKIQLRNRSELVSPLSIRKKGKTKTKNIHVKGKVEIGWLFVNYKSLTRAILHAQWNIEI